MKPDYRLAARLIEMLDPLQNILHCAEMIIWAREKSKSTDPNTKLICMVGEMDYVCELQAEMERQKV